MYTSPSVGSSNPAIILSEVVLPQPDGPSMEKNSPSRICMATSRTALTISPEGPGKRLDTLRSSTANSGIKPISKVDMQVVLGVDFTTSSPSWGDADKRGQARVVTYMTPPAK